MYDMFLNYCKTSSALIKPVNLPPQGLAKVFKWINAGPRGF